MEVTPRANIVIVDDTPANLSVLNDLLSENGYEVYAFPRAELLLNTIDTLPVDIFLLDITMPEMNGFELCQHIKNKTNLQDVPVLFISALNEVSDKIKGFKVGGVDYITKPFQFDEVLARVETHINLRLAKMELKKYTDSLEELIVEKTREVVLTREESSRVKREILANISHEMRTPLNAIMGVFNYIKGFIDDGEITEFIDEGMLASERLMRLVNNVIRYSQSTNNQKDKMLLEWQTLIDDALRNVIDVAKSKGLLLSVAIDNNLPDNISGPFIDIVWVLELLLDNAVKFTEQGEIQLTVEFDQGNDQVVFKIFDSGRGIPSSHRKNLFSLFEQGDGSAARAIGGTGLGLALSKKIVNSWRGKIWLAATDEYGSVFAFTYPLTEQRLL